MPIYKIAYLSGPHTVYGYLGVPPTVATTEQAIARHIQQYCPAHARRPVLHCSCDYTPLGETPPVIGQHIEERDYPALIYCRGGIGRVGQVRLEWIRWFTEFGFVVFAPCYRGSEGGSGRDEFGGDEQADVTAAFNMVRGLPFVNRDRISLLGFSRGSINATLCAASEPRAHSLVLWGGVSDLATTYDERIDLRRMLRRVVGGTPTRYPDAYRMRSPLHLIDKVTCSLLLIHGTNDIQVNVSHADRMRDFLRDRGRSFTYHRYLGLGHHLPPPLHEAVVQRMLSVIL